MNKTKLINLIRAIIVAALAGAILVVTTNVLILKSEDGLGQIEAMYKQKDNTVDVIFLGSSQAYCNINTGVLWDEYGMAAFDLGGAEAPTWNSYYYLKEALKTQSPKIVALEVSTMALQPFEYQYYAWIEDNHYGMKWNENRIDSLKVSTREGEFLDYLFPLGPMHGRYNDLSKNDFVDENNTINYKGFDPRETIYPLDAPDISQVSELGEVPQKHLDYYYKIIELCKEENIPLVIIKAPYGVSEDEQKVYNFIFDIAKQNGVPYIDFNKCYDEMGLDFQTDMADPSHVNMSGNYKYSKYLGQRLKEMVSLEDHRGDKKYDSWEADAAAHRNERLNADLRNATSNADFVSLLNNPSILAVITLSPSTSVSDDKIDEDVICALEEMGVTRDELEGRRILILSGGTKAYSDAVNECKVCIDNKDDTLVFDRKEDSDEYAGYVTRIYLNEDEYTFQESKMEVFVYNLDSCEQVTMRLIEKSE